MHDHGWQGEYFLGEAAVHHLKPKERATLRNEQIGFVFQQYHLLDDLTVYENLDIPLSYRRYSKSERAALVGDMLDRFQIVGKKDLYPRQLSGGQQQLVGVARAIIASPKLLLAVQPTGNLQLSQGERSHSFTSSGIASQRLFNLMGSGEPRPVRGAAVTADYFTTLGVKAVAGRLFRPEEDRPNGGPVAAISYELWKQLFGADPTII